MKKLLLILCALLCLAGTTALAEDTLTIVHVTDMHYLSPELTDYGEPFMELIRSADGKVTHYTPELMKTFVAEMLEMQPDAVILSGDLTFNGAVRSHEELISLLTPLKDAGIQVLALSGNHDTNAAAYRFEGEYVRYAESMADEAFDDAYAALGYEEALSRDVASMSYVARLSPEVWCLLVDVNANGIAGTVHAETLAWIREQLEAARQASVTVIAVSHQPALLHNRLFTFGYVINNSAPLLELYEAYGVPLSLCGHLHMQHIVQSGGLVEIAGSSLAVSPNQYGVIRVKGGRLLDYRTQALDVAAWAEKNSPGNPDLLHFAAYAADFFDQTTRSQLAAMLAESGSTPEEQAQMAAFALQLNAGYFSGAQQYSAADPAWELWQTRLPDSFFTYYMGSILMDSPRDMRTCVFGGE